MGTDLEVALFPLFDVKFPRYKKTLKYLTGTPTQTGTQHQRNENKALGIR
jgi:hypothetical protein